MIRIAVVDDEKKWIEQIRIITEKVMGNLGNEYELCGYTEIDNFLEDLKEKIYFDIYLLDVEMPAMNGIELARMIRLEFREPAIVYITNHLNYAMDAFEVNAYRYLPKSMLEDKLPDAYRNLVATVFAEHDNEYTIFLNNRFERLPYREIYYLRKCGKYVNIFHQRGESKVRKGLFEVIDELNSKLFLAIDRGYVVNINHVMRLNVSSLTMRNGDELQISRPRLKEVRERLMERWETR